MNTNNRVFPKVDHSARIVLGQLLNEIFVKDLTNFWQNNIEQMVNIYQRFDKVLAQ